MSDECKPLDPTAFGLFFVALLSLPVALLCFGIYMGDAKMAAIPAVGLLNVCSFFILIAAIGAYRAGSNFGFIVFGMVAAGVFLTVNAGGPYVDLTLALMFIIALVWSYRVNNLKLLTMILVTTALVFLFGGLSGLMTGDMADIMVLLKGVAALGNFALSLYLAFALADEKLPCY